MSVAAGSGNGAGCTISTHVLDSMTGVPAAGIQVVLEALDAGRPPDGRGG